MMSQVLKLGKLIWQQTVVPDEAVYHNFYSVHQAKTGRQCSKLMSAGYLIQRRYVSMERQLTDVWLAMLTGQVRPNQLTASVHPVNK